MTVVPERTLPGVAVPLSPLVLGTMTFGDTVDSAGAARMLDTALDAGISGVDTANGYAGGATEEILGKLLPTRRDRIVLATKAGMPHPDAGEHAPLSPEGLRASVDGSLVRLGVEQIDLLYLHQPDRKTPLSETLATIARLVDEGKIAALGVSNFAAWQIAEINHCADEVGAPRPVVAQQLYNLLARRIEDEYAEFAETTNLLTMVYNPLAGGLLTGRHSFGHTPSSGRFADSRLAEMYRKRYWDERLFDAVEQLTRVADDAGITLAELSLRWLLSKQATAAVLLGGSTVEHLLANVTAMSSGPLPPDVLDACDAVGAFLYGPMPAYNR
ncbi:aryl-alcohol dehydrogenase-like predicted oxidoreductase [Halopolyspora algeriensis]|uniref:Aryl-alcohol dehydrogenase-like predicted oxidoreductase n=1 Tax=Halopolyspora algeriensis TaxID=1500506 RepID=A0A368VKI3_9ACTN|nr:aldo/keto reductase [Halopolyspora algeriensis]RCW41069.1 aryl-alcohol dehydrogenase-like predicted oxidoreductase [Halopolyspora algeriensis]TQM53847.1 aryl-alcohol dehydrogenase-like predicted oxidoreductase [Halopolyspora algeriensis]